MYNERNEGMFRDLVENLHDIVIVTDKEFRIRYVSSAILQVFGIEPVALLGRSIFNFVPSDKVQLWKDAVNQSTDIVRDEISLTVKGAGKVYFDVQISNLLQQFSVQGLVLKLHDITKKKESEQLLIRSNQQLDQVLYKTTHDLKAPLLSALGLVKLAQQATAEEKDQYLNSIKKSLVRLDSFIDEMNHFFKSQKFIVLREVVDVETLVREEFDSLTTELPLGNVELKVVVHGHVGFYSDQLRVKTIITNLVSNAIKYQDKRKGQSLIEFTANTTREFCELTFRDNGIGIDSTIQDKIFDLFFRGTEQASGTGIGLFIVNDTIQKLGGSIEVKSTVGVGTTFFVRIPNQLSQPEQVEQ